MTTSHAHREENLLEDIQLVSGGGRFARGIGDVSHILFRIGVDLGEHLIVIEMHRQHR